MDISTLFQVALIEFDRIVMGGDSWFYCLDFKQEDLEHFFCVKLYVV